MIECGFEYSEFRYFAVQVYEILTLITLAWLLVLTGLFVYLFSLFSKITEGTSKENIITILNKVLKKETANSTEIKSLFSEISRLDKEGKFNFKKYSVTKFNPFGELGGDHSFSLALLDGNSNGLIITSIHTREKTRVYLKEVSKGVSKIDLSKEEKKALEIAVRM